MTLQFPDFLLCDSTWVVEQLGLRCPSTQLFILGDTSYGRYGGWSTVDSTPPCIHTHMHIHKILYHTCWSLPDTEQSSVLWRERTTHTVGAAETGLKPFSLTESHARRLRQRCGIPKRDSGFMYRRQYNNNTKPKPKHQPIQCGHSNTVVMYSMGT